MKLIQRLNPVSKSVFVFMLLMNNMAAADASPVPVSRYRKSVMSLQSIKINRSLTSRKYKIKLYTDYKQEAMFFSASGPKQKIYQLYLFDLAGTLIKQATVLHKQTTLVQMNNKGTYLFEVFSDDERIESGEVLVN